MPDLLVSPCAHLVTRNDAEHRYYGPDGFPFSISVTGVLSANDPPSKRAAIESTRHLWERRGTLTHAALEQFICTDRQWVPPADSEFVEFAPWIVPLLHWRGWDEVTFTASEVMTFHPEDDLAGTFDGGYRNSSHHHVLFDLKSRGNAAAGTYSTAAQLGGYLHLCERWGIHFDIAATIWARPGRWPTVSLYSLDDCRAAWAKAWAAYQQSLPF